MNNFRRVPLILVLALAALATFGSLASAGKPVKTVYYDYNYQANYKPREIFLTADAGPYLKKLHWKNWGSKKSVGRGRFISDCASCGPKENKPVVVTFKGLKVCKAQHTRTYKFEKIHVVDPSRKRVVTWHGVCPPRGYK